MQLPQHTPQAPTTAHLTIHPIICNTDLTARLEALAHHWGISAAFAADFKAAQGEHLLLYLPVEGGTRRVLLLGLGAAPTYKSVREAFRMLAFKQVQYFGESLVVVADELTLRQVQAAVIGLSLSTYDVHLYRTTPRDAHPLASAEIWVQHPDAAAAQAIARGHATAAAQRQALDWVNADAVRKRPEALAASVVASGKAHGYAVTVYDKEAIEELGMEAFLAVNRGSEFPPALIVAEYTPQDAPNAPKVGLVGKGVTFDTGGLNIKTAGMHYMKSDMGGAAAVLGAIELVARLQLPVHLKVVVAATDNAVDALSVRPSDVIGSYSGKTIEIIDTDAEGRLTLADAVCYLNRTFSPDVLIDVATLTGAAVRALGYHAGALLSEDDALVAALEKAGQATGERVWRLPLFEEYHQELQSDVADIANLGKRPMAGASTAAKFVQYFTDEHSHWAHLDIAGVAFGDSPYTGSKAATAYGVDLLVTYLEQLVGQA